MQGEAGPSCTSVRAEIEWTFGEIEEIIGQT